MTSTGDLARTWADAVARTGLVPFGITELEELLTGSAADLRAVLDAGPFDAAAAGAVGARLVAAGLTAPEALRITVERLGAELLGSGDPVDRVVAVQGAVAAGYTAALRDTIQREQDAVLRAVLDIRRDAEDALRASDARFHAVFSQAGVGIAIVDLDGAVLDANAALVRILGHPGGRLRDARLEDLVHSEDVARLRALSVELLSGARDDVRTEMRFCRLDGAVLWGQVSATLVRDADDAPRFGVVMLEDVSDRHRLQNRLRHQALHDPLTHLPNRALFLDRLTAAFDGQPGGDGAGDGTGGGDGEGRRVSLCYLDLDGFKVVNDSLGHHVGDQLLIAAANRIRDVAGPDRLAARMGGDEFVVLSVDSAGGDEAVRVADDLLRALSRPIAIAGHELTVSASIGVVEQPVAQTTAAELMQAADITLYWAKGEGGGRWARYDAERNARDVARFTLAANLPGALDREEFVVDYQPLVRLDDGTLAGVEALVRWQHPTLGRLAPDRFVGLAEETGLIVPLGRWVLRQACLQATKWDGPFISVNLAERQVREPGIVDEVAGILTETGLPPDRLQLELTESAVMGGDAQGLLTLHELAGLGVRIAIDDFGTGWSNLAYLRRLPVSELKLAGSFMEGLRTAAGDPIDQRIVETLVALARALGLTVTAENVETHAQATRLRIIGVDHAQGWLYARPGPPEDIDEILEAERSLRSL